MISETRSSSRIPGDLSAAGPLPRSRAVRARFRLLALAALLAVCLSYSGCFGGIGLFIPLILSATPNTVTAGASALTVVISGSGFASAIILANGQPIAVTSESSTQLQATIPGTLLATPGTVTLVVVNALPSQNVHSNAFVITVTGVTTLPVIALTKSHTGDFTQGQISATFQVTVSNTGTAPTSGMLTITELPPSSLNVTMMAGTGWSCTVTVTATCSRSDALDGSASYPAITVTVNVATNAPASVVNQVSSSGGGAAPATASDTVTVSPAGTPTIAISATASSPTLPPGSTGSYTVTVSNTGTAPTSGTVTVMITLDAAEILSSLGLSGTGWACNNTTLTCTISVALPADQSFNTITVPFVVSTEAGATLSSTFTVAVGEMMAMVTVVTPT